MSTIVGERTLMRIAVNSAERYGGEWTYRALVLLLRDRGFAGATVLPCIMGFGARRVVYSEMSDITSIGMPVIVEAVDTEARILAVLPDIDRMVGGGVITLERAQVVVYRGPGGAPPPAAPEGAAPPETGR